MRRFITIAAAAIATCAFAAPAGANATKGATYEGQNSKGVKLVFKVASSGHEGRADLYCTQSHASAIHHVPIVRGSFKATRKTGSIKVFTIKGRFTSPSEAQVTVSLGAVCAGGNYSLTLTQASGV